MSFSSLLAGAISSPVTDEKHADTDSSDSYGTNLTFSHSSEAQQIIPIRPSTARFKSMTPSRLPIPKACVTIPPGLSPTTLLDSPVLFSSQAEPSPTTGTFPLPPLLAGIDSKNHDRGGSSFVFRPLPMSRSCPTPLGGMGPFGLFQQHFASTKSQLHPQIPKPTPPLDHQSAGREKEVSLQVPKREIIVPDHQRPEEEEKKEHQVQLQQQQQQQQKQQQQQQQPKNPPQAQGQAGNNSDDGFNWRKYGQKVVKGSENPRSYYKCTYVNCPMKKKVERSPDGQVTEIVYEGEHNHPKPQPSRRMALIAGHIAAGTGTASGVNKRNASVTGSSDIKTDYAVDDFRLRNNDSGAIIDGSSLSDDDVDPEDPAAKRRKKESSVFVTSKNAVREPRVVVQTTSEVDVLDDGYRWRKYGQKVVKGNPNPRSYYKCTNLGCPVRKHVERACDDNRAVITTYEGKHNHDVPAARNSGGGGGNGGGVAAAAAADSAAPTLSGGSSDISLQHHQHHHNFHQQMQQQQQEDAASSDVGNWD